MSEVQLRFSLYSGMTTRWWSQFILHLLVFKLPAQLMQSYAPCLLPSLPGCCSCLLCCSSCSGSSSAQCIAVSACPLFWVFAASFMQVNFQMYAGILCLHHVCWDSVSNFPMLWLASTACWDSVSSFLAFDWLTACWDSLPRLLHAGIACLAPLAFDWPNACWDSLFALSMLG